MTVITEPGLYPELADEYFKRNHTPTRSLSQSGIKTLLAETPFDYMNPPEPKKPSEEKEFGSIVHAIALDQGKHFSISPFADYRTKDAQKWRDDTRDEGKIPVKPDRYQDALKIGSIIKAKIRAAIGDSPYLTEVPMFWLEGDTWCSAMMDVWCEEKLFGVDPKVTNRIGKVARAHMIGMGWDIQQAWYRRGLEKIFPQYAGRVRFGSLLVRPDPPFASRGISISEAWRHSADMECDRALNIFRACMASGEWPSWPDGFEVMDAPAWTIKERIEAAMMAEDDEAAF